MPELPEVETIARGLAAVLTGRILRKIEIFDEKLKPRDPERAYGATIGAVARNGKRVMIVLRRPASDNARELYLFFHLRMTGRLIFEPGEFAGRRPHLRARLVFDDGNLLFFDTRRFGLMELSDSVLAGATGGMDPFDPDLSGPVFHRMLAKSKQAIKQWLLRQDKLVGLGNIYASEILFDAGIHPTRSTSGRFKMRQCLALTGMQPKPRRSATCGQMLDMWTTPTTRCGAG